jgi:hypothetical protein
MGLFGCFGGGDSRPPAAGAGQPPTASSAAPLFQSPPFQAFQAQPRDEQPSSTLPAADQAGGSTQPAPPPFNAAAVFDEVSEGLLPTLHPLPHAHLDPAHTHRPPRRCAQLFSGGPSASFGSKNADLFQNLQKAAECLSGALSNACVR